jgi:hypothetical protein
MNPQDGKVTDLASYLEDGTMTADQVISCPEDK